MEFSGYNLCSCSMDNSRFVFSVASVEYIKDFWLREILCSNEVFFANPLRPHPAQLLLYACQLETVQNKMFHSVEI